MGGRNLTLQVRLGSLAGAIGLTLLMGSSAYAEKVTS
jgi:hypothetical protein